MLWAQRRAAAQEHLARFWPWLIATLVATLVNPWGWKVYSWALGFMSPMSSSQSQSISEWAAPSLTWRSIIGGLSFTHPELFCTAAAGSCHSHSSGAASAPIG